MKKVKVSILLLFFITLSVFAQEKKYTSYKAEKGETIQSLSRKFSITPYSLLQLNPDIKNGIEENQLIIVPNIKYDPTQQKEHVDYVKDGFLFHKIVAKENYYRLKKKYRVSKRKLKYYNSFLKNNELKVGDILKIPVKKNFKLDPTEVVVTDTKFYIVKPKETKYKISRRYGISIEKLEELNPEIKESGLQMAQVIKVPNTEEIPDANEKVIEHQIEKGETLFSLSQRFNISQGKLLEMNPHLKDGVKEGVMIQTSLQQPLAGSTASFVSNIPLNKKLNIVMMLPFLGNKATINFEKDRAVSIVTDFYLGALIALDSVKKQGLSVHMDVFDTQNSVSKIASILKTNNFDNVDAIIGPMYVKNVEFVSNAIRNDSIVLISPVSSKNHSKVNFKNTIIEIPQKDKVQQQLYEKVLNYIEKNYKKQNLIVIADDLEENKISVKNIVARLQLLDTVNKIKVLKPEKGYIKPQLYRKALQDKKENWVILITEDGVVTADAINNLGVLPEKTNVTLFSLQFGRNFNKINNDYLARLNFHYPVVNFEDVANKDTQYFVNKYKSKYFVAPSDYAFKGFDITYDALLRLASYSTIDDAFRAGISERTTCKFQYVKNNVNGFENLGLFLIKYDGLDLVKVE